MSDNKMDAFKTIAGSNDQQQDEQNKKQPATVQEVMENAERPEDQAEEECYEDSAIYTTDVRQDECTPYDLLYKQQIRHSQCVRYQIVNRDLRNLILSYNNDVSRICEELPEDYPLPIESQTYQEFVEQIKVPDPLANAQLFQITRQYIDNIYRYKEILSSIIYDQGVYKNPFYEALQQVLEFEKLNIAKLKKCKRVYEVVAIIQETRKARMQIELRLVNLSALRKLIKQCQEDECAQSKIRQDRLEYEHKRRISNREEALNYLLEEADKEAQFRVDITNNGEPETVTDLVWLLEYVEQYKAQSLQWR